MMGYLVRVATLKALLTDGGDGECVVGCFCKMGEHFSAYIVPHIRLFFNTFLFLK